MCFADVGGMGCLICVPGMAILRMPPRRTALVHRQGHGGVQRFPGEITAYLGRSVESAGRMGRVSGGR